LRVLIEKLRLFIKLRLLTKPGISLLLLIMLLLFAGILALTQESSDGVQNSIRGDSHPSDVLSGESPDGFQDEEEPPVWTPPGPPRWFRSNSGGMALEEIPSRLAALRNRFALVIDYVAPDEIEPRLLPFYQKDYTVEIRVLYEWRKEYRRQWLFRDESGTTRLNAVFKPPREKNPDDESGDAPPEARETVSETEIIENEIIEDEFMEDEFIAEESAEPVELAAETSSGEAASLDELSDDAMPEPESFAVIAEEEILLSTGFIEIFNEKAQIIEDRWFFEDDSEVITGYFYNMNTLVRAETGKKIPASAPDVEPELYHDEIYRLMYTDTYRYNRSYSLRYVERLYHQRVESEPVRLVFPGRVLDAAYDKDFMRDKLALRSDFLENFSVGEGYRIIYDTDGRGRILTQTMLDEKNETVWTIKNTWSGNRIVAMRKTEGENEKLTEYEYDREGNQVVQRDINNGVLERQVYTQGENETEELYMNGVVVLRAYWEKGRKVKEEQVRQR